MATKNLSDLLPLVDMVLQSEKDGIILIAEQRHGLYSAWRTDFQFARRIGIAEGPLAEVRNIIEQDWKSDWKVIGHNGNPFAEIQVWIKWVGNRLVASVSRRERLSISATDVPAGTWLYGEDTERLFKLLDRTVEEVHEEYWTLHHRLNS